MANYALITGNVLETVDLYSGIVRREGLEAVVVTDPETVIRIVAEKGQPKLVIADLEMARDAGFKLLRAVQTSARGTDRSAVVASVSRELRTTAGDLMEALGITEVLPSDADANAVTAAVRRVLSRDARSETDPCLPPPGDDDAEQTRIARVAATGLGDAPPDKALEDMVAQTAEAFGVPYALVSVTVDGGYWFKSHASTSETSLDARKPAFDESFCQYVVELGHPVLVVDAMTHPAFAVNLLVRGGVIATFAGAPLVTRDGDVLGALCILDSKTGSIPAARVDVLARLAKRVASEIQLRSEARASALEVIRLNEKLAQERERHQISKDALGQLQAAFSQLDEGIVLVDHERRVVFANPSASELLDVPTARMTGISRDDLFRKCAALFEDADAFLSKVSPSGLKAMTCDFDQERPVARLLRWSAKPVELPGGMGQMVALTALEHRNEQAVSGRYSVVPTLASTRPSRATGTRGSKRKGQG